MFVIRRPLYTPEFEHPFWSLHGTPSCRSSNRSNCLTTSIQVENQPQQLEFRLDLPGVKPENVKLQVNSENPRLATFSLSAERDHRRNGGKSTLSREWTLDATLLDLPALHGYLVDGVLTLVAPKKDPVQKSISVSSEEVPEIDEETTLSLNLDLPGLNPGCIEVTYQQAHVHILGSRTIGGGRGSRTVSINRKLMVDEPHTLNVDSFRAHLVDGVFVLLVDKQVATDDYSESAIQDVPISAAAPTSASIENAAANSADNDTKEEEEHVVALQASEESPKKQEWVDVETVEDDA